MSIIDTVDRGEPAADPIERTWLGRNMTLVAIIVGLVVISAARIIADAERLTAATTIGAGFRLAIPIALAGFGGLYAERSGTVNIGLEGMITLGTVMAGFCGWQWGPWAALIGGMLGGMAGSMVMSIATTNFGVNHIIAGFAINLIGPGFARYLANIWFTTPEAINDGGSITSSPRMDGSIPRFSVPWLSDGANVLGTLEDKGWFVVSDVAGIVRGLTTDVRLDMVIAIVLMVTSSYVLWRTPLGLRLRSAGEKPGAAESLGGSVLAMRHLGMAISGAFAGIAGAVLVFAGANQYQQGQVAGRGFLGLASLVFGNWLPAGIAAGASVFGYADGLANSLDSGISVRGLIVAVAIGLILLAIVALSQRRYTVMGTELAIAAVAGVLAYNVEEVNDQFTYMTPYVVTLVVITVFAQRQRPPAAEGIPYFKGQSL